MILCCGDALIDMLPAVGPDGNRVFAPHPGGAVFNSAVALGRLGVATLFLNGLSTDLFGDMLVSELDASGVDHMLCPRVDKPTTLAFIALMEGQARYVFYDEATASRMLTPADVPPLPSGVRALFFGGISLVAEPCGSTFESLMLSHASTTVTMIDPNIRPAFITDAPAYRARLDRMLGNADIVKLSEEDLEWLSGSSTEAAATAILDKGPSVVLITRGARGASAYMNGMSVSAAPRLVTIIDTVGAGDAFNAGFLEALSGLTGLDKAALRSLSEDALRTCLDRAVEVASVAVSRQGANPPWLSEISLPAWRTSRLRRDDMGATTG